MFVLCWFVMTKCKIKGIPAIYHRWDSELFLLSAWYYIYHNIKRPYNFPILYQLICINHSGCMVVSWRGMQLDAFTLLVCSCSFARRITLPLSTVQLRTPVRPATVDMFGFLCKIFFETHCLLHDLANEKTHQFGGP